MSIHEDLASYYEVFGVRGVFAISAYRLLGVPKMRLLRCSSTIRTGIRDQDERGRSAHTNRDPAI